LIALAADNRHDEQARLARLWRLNVSQYYGSSVRLTTDPVARIGCA